MAFECFESRQPWTQATAQQVLTEETWPGALTSMSLSFPINEMGDGEQPPICCEEQLR